MHYLGTFNFFIEVYLINNIVLLSGIQQNDSDVYVCVCVCVCVYSFLDSIIGHYKTLSQVPCATQ